MKRAMSNSLSQAKAWPALCLSPSSGLQVGGSLFLSTAWAGGLNVMTRHLRLLKENSPGYPIEESGRRLSVAAIYKFFEDQGKRTMIRPVQLQLLLGFDLPAR
jgi:hypothetical protein